jgi:hypothetical protein
VVPASKSATRYAARASVGLRLRAFFAATRATVAGLIISLSAQITGSLAHFPTPHRDVTLLFNLHLTNKKSIAPSSAADDDDVHPEVFFSLHKCMSVFFLIHALFV